MNDDKVTKKISDLGACAYLLMHGFKVCGYSKAEKSYLFEISQDESDDFEEKQDDYLNSDFHRFDSCLMSIKKRYKTY